MAKEWILNSATNRFQLNFKRNVGPTSESIRKCSPKSLEDWQDYYFVNVRSKEHLEDLGRKLYIKITEVLIADISEQDCIDYIIGLVINRTFEGYRTEITTIYGQLESALGVKIQPASDEWDRLFNVDFFVDVKGKYIGLQIKPVHDTTQITQIFKERALQAQTHNAFTAQYGGGVFYVFSIKEGKDRRIQNLEIIEDIREEMRRLSNN